MRIKDHIQVCTTSSRAKVFAFSCISLFLYFSMQTFWPLHSRSKTWCTS